jgi:hypothetical protein
MIVQSMKSSVYNATVAKVVNDGINYRNRLANGYNKRENPKGEKRFTGFGKNFWYVPRDKKAKKEDATA